MDRLLACLEAGTVSLKSSGRKVPEDALKLIGRRHVRSNNSWSHNSPILAKGPDLCTLMIHPDDASARNITDGARVQVSSAIGAIELPAKVTDTVMAGVVSIPHGYGHRKGSRLNVAAKNPGVSMNDILDNKHADALTGTAILNGTWVQVSSHLEHQTIGSKSL